MTRKLIARALAGAGLAAASVLLSSHAMAGVSNPDYYFIDIVAGHFAYNPSGAGGARFADEVTGQLEGDLAADGSFAYVGSAFNTVRTSIPNVNAQFVLVAGTSGMVDAAAREVRLTLRMRIKFSGTGVPTTCQTGLFTTDVRTSKTAWWNGVPFNPATGSFSAVDGDILVPRVTDSACGTVLAANINNTYGLGTQGNTTLRLDGSITNPAVPQPD